MDRIPDGLGPSGEFLVGLSPENPDMYRRPPQNMDEAFHRIQSLRGNLKLLRNSVWDSATQLYDMMMIVHHDEKITHLHAANLPSDGENIVEIVIGTWSIVVFEYNNPKNARVFKVCQR